MDGEDGHRCFELSCAVALASLRLHTGEEDVVQISLRGLLKEEQSDEFLWQSMILALALTR